jgi:ribose transport system ATP-binding protein
MAQVALTGIVKRFGGVVALNGVDLTIAPGETHALLGENGAGKSTLIRVLTGAIVPDEGRITVGGTDHCFTHPAQATAVGIAAVYQEPMIYPHLSVLENIFAGAEITGRFGIVRRKAMAAMVLPLLAQLDLPASLLARSMGSLSLGFQQMVLITKALMLNAQVIIFDEPTSILSQAETDRLFVIIERLRRDGRAIVYITHRLDEIRRIASRVTVLTDGRVSGTAATIDLDEPKLLALMAGKASRDYGKPLRDRAPPAPGVPTLRIAGLSRAGAYQNVDWQAPAGQVTGVYGLVGSGRSEVALAVFGALKPDRGTIELAGKRIAPRDPAAAVMLGIGYLPEDRKLQGIFASKPLEANLTAGTIGQFQGRGGWLDFTGLRGEAARLIGRYRIKARDETIGIGTLSGGNQQKALFARWAGQRLKLLILDEPTRGIDIGTKAEIHDFIRDLAASGLAVVVISSDLPEVLAVSDRIIVMRRGGVVGVAEGEAMNAEAILASAVGAHAVAA